MPKNPTGISVMCYRFIVCFYTTSIPCLTHTRTCSMSLSVCMYVCLSVFLRRTFLWSSFFLILSFFYLLSMLPFLPLFPFYLSILSLVLPQKNMTLENVIKNRIDFDCREKDRECQIESSDQKLTDRIWKHRITQIESENI